MPSKKKIDKVEGVETQKEEKTEVISNRINGVISNIKEKDFTFYFFVVDSKNNPNGSNAYIYNLAKQLQDSGYKVKMLYQIENEYTKEELVSFENGTAQESFNEERIFRGVKDWLGEEYDSLEHMNISQEEWKVSPADFLFIPEALSGLMFETFKHKIPCKRYVILQNFDYVTEFIPLGVEWANYGIVDVLANTEQAKKDIEDVFPYVSAKVLEPSINGCFRKPIEPKKLIVSIVAKNQSDVNKIVKPFYWKYPPYKFISFRDLRGFPREEFSKLLKESAITIWVDDDTKFGYSALEAIRCNNILIGKIPQDVPEWMSDGDTFYDNGIWFDDIKKVPDMLATVIGAWMSDNVPEELTNAMEVTNKLYTEEEFSKNVDKVFGEIIQERIAELEEYNNMLKNNQEETNEK